MKPSILKVLMTGGAGYLGSVLCEHLLDAGYDVTVVDQPKRSTQSLFHLCAHPRFHFVFGDVRDENLMRRLLAYCDVLIPLAAIVGAPACEKDSVAAQSVNFDAIQLLNRLRSRQQLVIFPNTNSGYGTRSAQPFYTEEDSLEPVSLYAQTKVRAETELLQTPNAISLRLASLFGISPSMRLDLLVNHFVYMAITEGQIEVYEKDFKRNFLHVKDAADCFIHCIRNAQQMTGGLYNVALDSIYLSKEELALKIKQHLPNFSIRFASEGKDPDKRNYVVSTQKIREAGFEAKRTLEDGIQELIKGYQMMGYVKGMVNESQR